jgi:hypothetical protein
MKIILSILLNIARLYLGIKVLVWLVGEILHPELHQLSEIELILVIMVMDNWILNSSPPDEKTE